MALRAESYGQWQEADWLICELRMGCACVGLFLERIVVDHVEGYCYACSHFGGYVFRMAMNGQLRTGTDKGNPTV